MNIATSGITASASLNLISQSFEEFLGINGLAAGKDNAGVASGLDDGVELVLGGSVRIIDFDEISPKSGSDASGTGQ